MKINIDNFITEYNIDIPEQLWEKLELASLKGDSYYTIPDSTYNAILSSKDKRVQYEHLLHLAAEMNNKGIAAERNGSEQEAIDIYEQNIKDGVYVTIHPYKRLAILYRKRGDRANELRVINKAIADLKNTNESEFFTDRLAKLQ